MGFDWEVSCPTDSSCNKIGTTCSGSTDIRKMQNDLMYAQYAIEMIFSLVREEYQSSLAYCTTRFTNASGFASNPWALNTLIPWSSAIRIACPVPPEALPSSV